MTSDVDLDIRVQQADQFDLLYDAVHHFVALASPTLEDWFQLRSVYIAFRDLYVPARASKPVDLDKLKARADAGDEIAQRLLTASRVSLSQWQECRLAFKELYRSPQEVIRETMTLYGKIQSKWHKKTPEYKAQQAEYAKKRAKKLGLNKTVKAKTSKKAWAESPEGLIWWANYREKRNEKHAERVAAKKVAEAEAKKKAELKAIEAKRTHCDRCPAPVKKGRKLCDDCFHVSRNVYMLRQRRAS